MIPYIFVAAALTSVFAVLIIFKLNMDKLIEKPTDLHEVQKKFLISIGVSKVIPVILLIFGMVKMGEAEISRNQLTIPLLIILATVIYGLYYISSKKKLEEDEDITYAINTLTFIARPLIFSIPLMAIVFLLMMMK